MEYDLHSEIQAASRIVHGHFINGVELQMDLQEVPKLMGRPREIGQVLVNLLVNAAQAIRGQGVVKVSTGIKDARVWVQVEDSGIGMDAATQKHLFEPFFTTKPVGEGTGLGLSVVHGIVKSHKGSIVCVSDLGHGTRFTIHLPTQVQPLQQALN